MQQDKVKYEANKRLFIAETIMTILFAFNANTITRLYKLCDMLDATRTDKGLDKYGLVQRFADSGEARSMFGSLRNKCGKYDQKIEGLCHGYLIRVSNAMDAAQDVLDPIFNAVERYVDFKTTRKTLSTPKDPVLLSRCISCLIFLDMTSTFFDDITSENNFHEFNKSHSYRFLRMNQVYDQLSRVLLNLPWEDTKGHPLSFNIDGVIHSEFVLETLKDLMHLIYSAEFADIVIAAREGESLNFTSHFKSFVDRFAPETLTIEQYKQKYNNIQWTSHSLAS